jgi:hypothetical protein
VERRPKQREHTEWSKHDSQTVTDYFYSFFSGDQKLPRKRDVVEFQELHPSLKNLKWETIRTKVFNAKQAFNKKRSTRMLNMKP